MPQLSSGDLQGFHDIFHRISDQVHSIVIGQREPVWLLVATFFAKGHALLEGNPGTSKTTAVKALAKALGLKSVRIQGTPDLMPADIIGNEILNMQTGRFEEWRAGPLLQGNIVIVDEINRMTPKTQSATLEAFQEKSVTFAGNTYPVPEPYAVFATMNPIEQEGTHPLPEAQLDRFLVKILMEKLQLEELLQIAEIPGQDKTDEKLNQLESVFGEPPDIDRIRFYRDMVDEVELGDVVQTIARVVEATTPSTDNNPMEVSAAPREPRDYIRYGGSPRGMQALVRLSKVAALSEGMPYVQPTHLEKVLSPAMRHRILLRYEHAMRTTPERLLEEVLARRG